MMSEERARQMLVEYIERTKKSQSDVAKEMDVSPAYVSEFLKGTYKSPETAIPKKRTEDNTNHNQKHPK